jgi:hypothetical protein
MNNIANSDTVTPSVQNIESLFAGTEVASSLEEILQYLNDKNIIQRQPNGNYSILFTALPGEEIQKIKEELMLSNFQYTDQVIKFGDTATTNFDKIFKQVYRQLTYQFFSKQSNEFTLLNRIANTQREAKSYELFLAILVAKTQEEMFELKDIAERNSQEDRFQNTIFVVMEAYFEEKNYDRFIEYQANAQCAQRHGLPQQQKTYSNSASEMIQEWTTRMKSSNVSIYLRGEQSTISGSKLVSTINFSIAHKIFSSGPESLELIRTRSSVTFWKKASVKATVDAVLSYHSKQDIIAACGGQARHVEFLLQDSVDENLNWKPDVDPNHPLKKVCDYVDEYLSQRHTSKNQSFNLGEKLIGLTKAPFGLFQGYAPMAMVAFAMRKYANLIFDTNGKPRGPQHLVEDVVDLFKAWDADKLPKLNYMFESREAGKLCKHLTAMFSLTELKGYSDISSLKDARWAILHVYAKEKGCPLWSLLYCNSKENTDAMRALLNNVIKVVADPESMKNPQLLISTISGYEELKYEWQNMLIENEGQNFKEGFINFLKSQGPSSPQDDEVDEAMAFLRGHLEGEVGLWKEDEVRDKLKDWRIDKNRTNNPPTPTPSTSDDAIPEVHDGGEYYQKLPPQKVAEKREKLYEIMKFMPAQEAKDCLSHIIEKEDWLLDIILKYVQ